MEKIDNPDQTTSRRLAADGVQVTLR